MKHYASETMEGAALMARLEEMLAEHQQRIVAHLSPDELRALLDYVAEHDRLANTRLFPTTLDFIRKRLSP